MARYKIEYTYDDTKDKFGTGWYAPVGASAGVVLPGCVGEPTVTKLPDPPIKQRFIVEIESPATFARREAVDLEAVIYRYGARPHAPFDGRTITVTEG